MKIAVWYHCKLSGKGIPDPAFSVSIMAEQMAALEFSGLMDAADEVRVHYNGPRADGLLIDAAFPKKAEVFWNGDGACSELPTLARLRQWLPGHRGWAVLYHHSKGVTRLEQGQPGRDDYKANQRRMMEKWAVWNWRQCVKDLERGFDAVGSNWVDNIVRPFNSMVCFIGNFWWANSSYLLELPAINDNCKDFNNTAERCQAEVWIGRCSRRPRVMDYERPELSAWCQAQLKP